SSRPGSGGASGAPTWNGTRPWTRSGARPASPPGVPVAVRAELRPFPSYLQVGGRMEKHRPQGEAGPSGWWTGCGGFRGAAGWAGRWRRRGRPGREPARLVGPEPLEDRTVPAGLGPAAGVVTPL